MERQIIVGYDPEHGSEDVLALGRVLSEALAARELVVTVLPWPSYLAPEADLERMAEEEMEPTFARIREARQDLAPETRAIPSGSAAKALHTVAEEEQAEVIALGSCHRGPIGRTLAGSVGESLMHGAPCAVAIAPRGYGDEDGHRLLRLAVAYDGSAESRAALTAATALAQRVHGELTVLTVSDYPHYGYATAWSVLSAGEIVDAERTQKQRILDEGLAGIPANVGVRGRLLTGSAGRVLTDASGDFDLMLLGSRAYGSLHRTLLGSTTRQVIRNAGCPVLILPRGSGSDPLGLSLSAEVAAD